jgi:hypothetical protein
VLGATLSVAAAAYGAATAYPGSLKQQLRKAERTRKQRERRQVRCACGSIRAHQCLHQCFVIDVSPLCGNTRHINGDMLMARICLMATLLMATYYEWRHIVNGDIFNGDIFL